MKMPLADKILTDYGMGDTFIETGTHKGDGVIQALNAGFRKIYSIEILASSLKHACARKQIKKAIKKGKVEILQGSSEKVLPDILPGIKGTITFWLDAHSNTDSVIYKELETIREYRDGTDVLLIDDVNMMPTDHKWAKTVTLQDVVDRVLQVNPDYKISYVDGKRKKDILVAAL